MHPFLLGLGHEDAARLREVSVHRPFRRGEVLMEEGTAPESLFLIDAGEVAIEHGDAVLRILRAPEVVGLLSVLDGQQRTARVRARTQVNALEIGAVDFTRLMETCPTLDRALIHHLAGIVRTQYSREAVLARSLSDFFSSPGAVMVPGPYLADPFEMLVFVMEGETARLRDLLPPGYSLIPGLGGRYLLTVSFFESLYSEAPEGQGKSFSYREVTPFVPCVRGVSRPFAFAPELYPDSYLAISIGRELYGFPKRYGQIERADDSVDLFVGGRFVMRATHARAEPIADATMVQEMAEALISGLTLRPFTAAFSRIFDALNRTKLALPLAPDIKVLVRQQRPSPDASARAPERDRLVEIPFRLTHLAASHRLVEPQVELVRDHFIHGRALAAFSLRMGFRFETARELGAPAKPRRSWIG